MTKLIMRFTKVNLDANLIKNRDRHLLDDQA